MPQLPPENKIKPPPSPAPSRELEPFSKSLMPSSDCTQIMAQELYKALNNLINPNNDYSHDKYGGSMDLLITGDDLNYALDILKKYKDKFVL